MTTRYDYKIIISGQHIEKYEYLDNYVFKGYERKKWEKKKNDYEKTAVKEQTEFAKSSLNRTRTVLRRLINSNYQLTKFITLTFGSEMHDLKQANYIFNLFTQRMTDRFPEFKYIAVPEFQPISRRVHYHLLSNLRYIPNKQIADIWKHGFIKINRIDKLTNVGAYICKYLSKKMCNERLFHKRKFLYSQGLNSPSELIGYPALSYFEAYVKNTEPVFEKEFNNEYLGKVSYKAYSLDFIPPLPKEETPFDKTILRLKMVGLIPKNYE
jgi:hypothetical protein